MLTLSEQKDFSINIPRAVRTLAATLLLFLSTTISVVAQENTAPVEISTQDDKKLYLIQTNAFQSFYIAPQSNNTITTNNILGDYLLWYFLDAGTDNGVQYYYIINNSTGKCIYNHNGNSRGISLTDLATLSDADKEKCKFKLVVDNSDGTTGFYNIDVKASQQYYGLNKQSGSMANDNPIRLTEKKYIHDTNSKWKFIAYNGTFTWPEPPFTVSDDLEYHYYKIHNLQNSANYISINSANNQLLSKNTASDYMMWYFKEAPSDASTPWFKYYYIVNPESDDKYMYYSGTATDGKNQSNVVSVNEYDPDNEDRYQFIVVQAAKGDGPTRVECYAIIPKLLREIIWGSNSLGPSGNIQTSRSSNNTAQWTFDPVDNYEHTPQCVLPQITFSGTTGVITITSATPGVTIYYTTDGSDPTDESTVYSGPFELGYETQTIKAIAVRQGFTQSGVATYSVTQFDTPQLSFSNTDNKLTITSDGDFIYYTTDGTEPVIGTSNTYSEPFTLLNATTVKAIAVKVGYYKSQTASKSIDKVVTPVIEMDGLNTISISTSTTGAAIYYTTDGTTPDASATRYYEPFTLNGSGITVKAVAVLDDYINSDIASLGVTLTCDVPVIRRNGMSFIIDAPQFPAQGVTVYYTTDGSTPTTSSPVYTGSAVEFGEFGITVKAMATAPGYNNSAVVSKVMMDRLEGEGTEQSPYLITSDGDFRLFVANANQDGQDKYYKVTTDINAGGSNPVIKTFTGNFDGDLHTISNLSQPLFNTTDGAVVCNVILDNVSISTQANAGAICNDARGASRIYNCGVLATQSSTVSGTAYVGGLVGEIQGSSRVINCFSYADIIGGTDKGGIVGYNNYASTSTDIQTMVMNCMFYGDITNGGNISPVYGGHNINNLKEGGLNTYNYYRYESDYSYNGLITEGKYNCALAVMEKHLVRFEFYRQLLNSNRRLAAYYATGSAQNEQLMVKWVLETADRSIDSPKPYPILKKAGKYPSVINYDADNVPSLGTLQVNISTTKTDGGQSWPSGIRFHKTSMSVNRTGKDPDRYNFNYDKIQLPYYNDVATGNYTQNRVVTGWKITEITGGTAGSFTEADQWGGYNFADRNCTNKDLYTVSKRIFAQGAYYDVPNGVTSITIEPYWAVATYASDQYYDVVYSTNYEPQSVELPGVQYENGNAYDINGSLQTVYTSIESARAAMSITGGTTVYDYAVVLVGNVHQETPLSNGNTPYTIMSADLDFDNEPDYSFIFSHSGRQFISPIRFDFLNVPGTAMAQKPNGASQLRNVSIIKPKGWFEITNTCIISFPQFEYEGDSKSSAPLILLGGSFDQFASTQKDEPKNTQYIHLGGNVWFKEFGNGTHSDGDKFTRHIPVSVTGGDFEKFYLSGTYRPDAVVKADNAECYVSGGRFGEMAGAAMQQINGDVTWQINYADITDFYGGGINAAKPVTGNITVDIQNSVVGTYCGGPKFGDMADSKTVTTNAADCTFGKFFGAGYGGTSYNRVRTQDQDASKMNFNTWQNDYTNKKGKYVEGNGGVATDFDYDFFVWSTGVAGGRFYVKYASFSLAKTENVNSTLNNCTVTQNFYGGGNLGKVDGNVTSILNNCNVAGNVFGAGYSATIPIVPIRDAGFTKLPIINMATGFFEDAEFSGTTDYTWVNGTLTNGSSGIDTQNKLIYTDADLTTLGQVSGNVTLTINGGMIEGSIYGGGDESQSHGNTQVNIDQSAVINGFVYGGGNQADVEGNTLVNVHNGTLRDVFGGGNMANVGGDVTVNIGKDDGTSAIAIQGDVYGGGALAFTNTANRSTTTVNQVEIETVNLGDNSKKTVVNLYPGATINGDVYGGGKGKAPTPGDPGEAIVYGNVTVYQFGAVLVPQYSDDLATSGRIFGCNNVNGSPRGHALVYIKKTARNQAMTGLYDLAAVYGGGNMAEYLPYNHATDNSDFAEVMIDPDDCDDITIHSVYGGGNAASTPATKVTINGGEIEYTFGGGNGAGEGNTGANVGYHAYSDHTSSSEEDIAYRQEHYMYGSGQATTNILGGTIHHIYGGSNTLGNVRHASIVKLDGVGTCPLVVDDEMHGGGREAYMEGKALIDLGCITGMNEIYGGSENADVGGDIELTITSGTYGKVFGGNNKGGRVYGSITLNIEQTGCLPIVIDELYLGGNNAPYSVYGYTDQTTTVDIGGEEITQYQPKTRQQYLDELSGGDPDYDPDQDPNYKQPYDDPVLNIRSFDRIGTVFGGGNGVHATMVGNPTVDINVTQGYIDGKYTGDEPEYQSYKVSGVLQENGNPKYGVIETVFGGGNEADVIGTTNIRIGDKTGSQVTLKSTNQSEEVMGATITGNVYGGGNEADVTDGTNIKVGPDE